ncbi:MAG: ATP12 family protein [Parasphingorhabdus sp.]
MKRFYKNVDLKDDADGFKIHLDGRPVKTPARNGLILPTRQLAEKIIDEWESQGQEINPDTMPMTALAQGALDQVVRERQRIVGRIAAFADSDMLYFRGDNSQADLVEHQAENWDPLLDWARSRFDVSFKLVHGIMHESQSDETIARLSVAVESHDNFALAAMLSISGLTGSLIATLALFEKKFDPVLIWQLSNLEELWQEQQWGSDELAQQKRDAREAEYLAAVAFLELSRT